MKIDVLIVDDSAAMRQFVAKSLQAGGLEVGVIHEAGDGIEALAVLERAWVDVALVDVNMPRMNGEELVAQVRLRPSTVTLPMIIVSTEGSATRLDRLRGQGVGVVRKPFRPAQLADEVKRMLGDPA